MASWTRGRELGRGCTATVSVATFSDESILAVKSSKSQLLLRELEIHSSLCCPNVVAYKGFDVSKEGYNLFMEYVPGGTLLDEIRRKGGCMDERTIRSYTCQILRGIDYLHSKGVVHCDIKCSNILISEEHQVKLADFGCAKRSANPNDSFSIAGTPVYMAPETARGEQQGPEADIWALGCAVIEMVTGKPAWPMEYGSDPARILYRVAFSDQIPALPSCLSEQGKDFLSKCLVRDPKRRWNATELLSHPFVKKLESLVIPNSLSPTSILDHQLWTSSDKDDLVLESEMEAEVGISGNLEDERMEQLAGVSGRPSWSWRVSKNWIPVRSECWWSNSQQNTDDECCFRLLVT